MYLSYGDEIGYVDPHVVLLQARLRRRPKVHSVPVPRKGGGVGRQCDSPTAALHLTTVIDDILFKKIETPNNNIENISRYT